MRERSERIRDRGHCQVEASTEPLGASGETGKLGRAHATRERRSRNRL
jgi:hypothetical protein